MATVNEESQLAEIKTWSEKEFGGFQSQSWLGLAFIWSRLRPDLPKTLLTWFASASILDLALKNSIWQNGLWVFSVSKESVNSWKQENIRSSIFQPCHSFLDDIAFPWRAVTLHDVLCLAHSRTLNCNVFTLGSNRKGSLLTRLPDAADTRRAVKNVSRTRGLSAVDNAVLCVCADPRTSRLLWLLFQHTYTFTVMWVTGQVVQLGIPAAAISQTVVMTSTEASGCVSTDEPDFHLDQHLFFSLSLFSRRIPNSQSTLSLSFASACSVILLSLIIMSGKIKVYFLYKKMGHRKGKLFTLYSRHLHIILRVFFVCILQVMLHILLY